MRTSQTITALADDARVRDPRFAGFSVGRDGNWLDVLSVRKGADGMAIGFAVNRRTNLVCAFRQTGTVVRQDMVRVRVAAAEDTGDAAGTLRFDFAAGFGGRVNYALVRTAPEMRA